MKSFRFFYLFILILTILIIFTIKELNFDRSNTSSLSQPIIISSLKIPQLQCPIDYDGDGVDDLASIVAGARAEVMRRPAYTDAYYQGGYPPDNEGVCTDLVWRAFRDAGYDLKQLIDDDIQSRVLAYPRTGGIPDPNIDFRRVPNLYVFFQTYGQELTTEVIPGDVDNLKYWQPGDIVIFDQPYEHIAIISDKRTFKGVPYLIHNAGPVPREMDELLSWPSKIIGHFRYPNF